MTGTGCFEVMLQGTVEFQRLYHSRWCIISAALPSAAEIMQVGSGYTELADCTRTATCIIGRVLNRANINRLVPEKAGVRNLLKLVRHLRLPG